jgi:hypothetical protein
MLVFKNDDQIADFFQKAVLAQMQGHPILATTYYEATINKLIENAEKLTTALINYDLKI